MAVKAENGQPTDKGDDEVEDWNHNQKKQELLQILRDSRQCQERKEPDEKEQQLADEQSGQIGPSLEAVSGKDDTVG